MNWTQNEYIRAFDFASEAHLGQDVPGSKRPYDTHFAKVTMEVIAALSTCPDCNGDLAIWSWQIWAIWWRQKMKRSDSLL